MSASPEGIVTGALALLNSEVMVSFRYLADFIDPIPPKSTEVGSGNRPKTICELIDMIGPTAPEFVSKLSIGKLGFKLEAAGKVRVFAMVECWTQ